MARFDAKPLNPSKLNRAVQRNPAIFGIPFIILMVAASYGMSTFTQTRYDLHDHKVKQVCYQCYAPGRLTHGYSQLSKAQELGLDKQRKKFDIREEYFVSGRIPRRLMRRSNQVVETQLTSRRRLGAKKNTKTERSTRMGRPSNRASTEALKPQKILAHPHYSCIIEYTNNQSKLGHEFPRCGCVPYQDQRHAFRVSPFRIILPVVRRSNGGSYTENRQPKQAPGHASLYLLNVRNLLTLFG